jgi:peptidoglycan/LPS O-acetylase OafA/YrhL
MSLTQKSVHQLPGAAVEPSSSYRSSGDDVTAARVGPAQLASSAAVRCKAATERTGAKPGRIPVLDFTKGVLVLVMVLYHWLNYFVGSGGSFYIYLRFLPPSFICISGFLISHVYLSKYRITDARLRRRLAIRGLKILGIFVLLNAVAGELIPDQRAKSIFSNFSLSNLTSIYVTGNFAGQRSAAFTILVPISYLLILAAGLLILSRFCKYIFHIATALCLLGICVLSLYGLKSGILELLTIGLVGVSAGYIPIHKINAVLRHPYALVSAYLCYVVAITIYDVPYLLQVVGVCLTLMLIYWLGEISGEANAISRTIVLLGKYSLLGYIVQIAILQLLRRGSRYVTPGLPKLGGSLLCAIGLTVIAIEVTDRARKRVPLVDAMYTSVFL